MTAYFHDNELAAKKIIEHVGKKIVIGVPLGLGKPIGILNALYRLASVDYSIDLTIVTALTLSRPYYKNLLEKNFVEPILNRLLKDYEDPLYETPRVLQKLPSNIKVLEFFLTPGKYLHNNTVQQNYMSCGYLTAVRDAIHLSINVIAQQVSPSKTNLNLYSLSCNTDLFHASQQYLKKCEGEGLTVAVIAEVNANLPFMYGSVAEVTADAFSLIVDTKQYKTLFALPREEISYQDHLMGIYSSCLVEDNGTLQIGIGKLGNALANALIFRQQENETYNKLLHDLQAHQKFLKDIKIDSHLKEFEKGLYAATEMFSDEYLQLYKTGILKKRVYDHAELQKLLNLNKISETITPEMIRVLIENKVINPQLTSADLKFLQTFGIFKDDIVLKDNYLILSSGRAVVADLEAQHSKQYILEKCLGNKLKSGKILHAAFFLGSVDFYSQLRHMSFEELQQIEMTSVMRTNSILLAPELLKIQHQNARFVNTSVMVTLLGSVITDGLHDYQEISGVGGQYDFVSMATQLENARAIINCRSTRKTKEGIKSNIIWDYPNCTLPRYLRDIVITEYGIADCRSKIDSEVIKALLNIADSRFQPMLLEKAKQSGKLPANYQIPALYKNNFPASIMKTMKKYQSQGYFKPYPFGSDLTPAEETIARALVFLKYCSRVKLFFIVLSSIFFFKSDKKFDKYLHRMNLESPKNLNEKIYKILLKYAIKSQLHWHHEDE